MPTLEHIQQAAFHLLGHAKELLHRVLNSPATLPPRDRANPARARRRIVHALEWAEALARTLSGAGLWLLPPPRTKPATPSPAVKPGTKPAIRWKPDAELRRISARRRTIRRAFATLPTALIARRIAGRLRISPHHDAWPADIFALTQTPAEIALQQRALHKPYYLREFAKSEKKADRLARYARAAYAAITPPPPAIQSG